MRKLLASMAVLNAIAFVAFFAVQPAQHANALEPRLYQTTETHDFGNLIDGAGESNTVTVPGADLGDGCIASTSVSTAGGTLTCNVTAADTAIVRLQNESGGALDLASATVRVWVLKANPF